LLLAVGSDFTTSPIFFKAVCRLLFGFICRAQIRIWKRFKCLFIQISYKNSKMFFNIYETAILPVLYFS
jgi:hypothetical protein